MPIVTSVIVENTLQPDGRRSVRERHVDSVGAEQFCSYLGPAGVDAAAVMAARVSLLNAALKSHEINANLAKALAGETDAFTFAHSSVDENLAALRELYRVATRWEVVILGHALHHQNLSNARVDTLFGTSNAAGRTAVRDRLLALDTKYHDVLTQAGA